MTVSTETKAYVLNLIKKAETSMKNNQFEDAEDYLRSAKGELHDANMGSSSLSVGGGFDVVPSFGKLKITSIKHR